MSYAGIPRVRCRKPAEGEWFRVLSGPEGGGDQAALRARQHAKPLAVRRLAAAQPRNDRVARQ